MFQKTRFVSPSAFKPDNRITTKILRFSYFFVLFFPGLCCFSIGCNIFHWTTHWLGWFPLTPESYQIYAALVKTALFFIFHLFFDRRGSGLTGVEQWRVGNEAFLIFLFTAVKCGSLSRVNRKKINILNHRAGSLTKLRYQTRQALVTKWLCRNTSVKFTGRLEFSKDRTNEDNPNISSSCITCMPSAACKETIRL